MLVVVVLAVSAAVGVECTPSHWPDFFHAPPFTTAYSSDPYNTNTYVSTGQEVFPNIHHETYPQKEWDPVETQKAHEQFLETWMQQARLALDANSEARARARARKASRQEEDSETPLARRTGRRRRPGQRRRRLRPTGEQGREQKTMDKEVQDADQTTDPVPTRTEAAEEQEITTVSSVDEVDTQPSQQSESQPTTQEPASRQTSRRRQHSSSRRVSSRQPEEPVVREEPPVTEQPITEQPQNADEYFTTDHPLEDQYYIEDFYYDDGHYYHEYYDLDPVPTDNRELTTAPASIQVEAKEDTAKVEEDPPIPSLVEQDTAVVLPPTSVAKSLSSKTTTRQTARQRARQYHVSTTTTTTTEAPTTPKPKPTQKTPEYTYDYYEYYEDPNGEYYDYAEEPAADPEAEETPVTTTTARPKHQGPIFEFTYRPSVHTGRGSFFEYNFGTAHDYVEEPAVDFVDDTVAEFVDEPAVDSTDKQGADYAQETKVVKTKEQVPETTTTTTTEKPVTNETEKPAPTQMPTEEPTTDTPEESTQTPEEQEPVAEESKDYVEPIFEFTYEPIVRHRKPVFVSDYVDYYEDAVDYTDTVTEDYEPIFEFSYEPVTKRTPHFVAEVTEAPKTEMPAKPKPATRKDPEVENEPVTETTDEPVTETSSPVTDQPEVTIKTSKITKNSRAHQQRVIKNKSRRLRGRGRGRGKAITDSGARPQQVNRRRPTSRGRTPGRTSKGQPSRPRVRVHESPARTHSQFPGATFKPSVVVPSSHKKEPEVPEIPQIPQIPFPPPPPKRPRPQGGRRRPLRRRIPVNRLHQRIQESQPAVHTPVHHHTFITQRPVVTPVTPAPFHMPAHHHHHHHQPAPQAHTTFNHAQPIFSHQFTGLPQVAAAPPPPPPPPPPQQHQNPADYTLQYFQQQQPGQSHYFVSTAIGGGF